MLCIPALAVALRLWGITSGLPYLYHADEPGNVSVAQRIFKTGDLNPHSSYYPPLFFHIQAAAYVPYYYVGRQLGLFSNRTDIPFPVMLTMGVGRTIMPSTFLLGRLLSAVLGTLAVILVLLAGWRLTDRLSVGCAAALLMAVSPVNVALARYVTPDTCLVFFLLGAFWASVLIFREGKTRHYVAAAVATGLTASTKYNGAFIVLSLLAAHFFRCGAAGWRDRRLYLALGTGALTFLLTTPIFLGHEFLHNFLYNAAVYSTGHAGMEGHALRWYITFLWSSEGPVVLLAVLALGRGLFLRSKATIFLSVFPLAYFILIATIVVRNDRTALPLTPFLFLLAASLLPPSAAGGRDLHPSSRRWWTGAIAALLLVSFSWSLVRTVRDTVQLTTAGSRETARVWINDHLPGGTKIAIESYAPYVDPQRFVVSGVFRMIDYAPAWYISNGFDYLVFSQVMFDRFYNEPDRYAQQVAQYQALFAAFPVIMTFLDGGSEIRICRVAPAELPK